MKWFYRAILLGFLFLSTILIAPPNKAFAGTASWNGVSRSDADWYYYDNGLCYYWQYSGYNPNMYEETWGYWTDGIPKIDTTTMYNNQDIRNYRVMGNLSDFGFTAINASWVGSRFAGNDGAPANVIYQRKVSTDYKRAKTFPTTQGVNVTNAGYVNGNDYWIKPSSTVQMQVVNYQNYAGNQQQLDDWVNQNYLRMTGSDGSDFRNTYIYNSGFQYFSVVSDINTSYNTSSYSSDHRTYYTTFNVQPTSNNKDYDIQSFAHSYNGKQSNAYIDSGKNLRTDGDTPSYISGSLTSALYQSGNTYWTKPNDTVYVNERQYDGRSGNHFSYLQVKDGTVDVRSQHDYFQATNHNYQFATDSNVAITSANRSESSGGYGTVQYGVTPYTSGKLYDLNYYFIDNVGNQLGNYVSTGMRLGADGVNPTVTFRNSADTSNFTSRGWASSQIDVRLKFSDGDSGYKQSRYAWTTSTAAPSTWSAWSTGSDYTVSKSGYGQWYLHVQAEDNVGNTTDTQSGPYNFDTAPVPDFSSTPATVYNDTLVSFTNNSSDADGNALTYQWSYKSPGSSTWTNFSTATNPTLTLNAKGTWSIMLNVSDGIMGNSVSKTITVQNRAPSPNFGYTSGTLYNDTNVSFTNSSTDPDGDSMTYKWEYQTPGSSTWVSFSTSLNASKVLNIKGSWNIRLTATDSSGASSSTTKTVVISNRAPSANFSYSPATIYNDTTVSFTNSSSDPDVDGLTYTWEYQDIISGLWTTFSNAQNPTKVLNIKGTWNIRLTVSDGSASNSISKAVIVQNRAPVANFTWSPSTIYNNTTVSFTNSSTDADGDTLTYQWEYQSPGPSTWVSFSTLANPAKILNSKGTWNIRLTVTDGTATNSVIKPIVVQNRVPKAGFNTDKPSYVNSDTVTITSTANDPDNDVLSYVYVVTKPDGQTFTLTTANPTFTNLNIGVYTIKQTVTDTSGASDSITKTIEVINRKPIVELTYSPTDPYEGDLGKVCVKATDPDNQSVSINIFISKDSGVEQNVLSNSNLPSGTTKCYTFTLEPGRYDIKTDVNDGYDTTTETTWFFAKPLIIIGSVSHTPEWETKHQSSGNAANLFYSGEKFLLGATTSPYPIEYVKSTLHAVQADDLPIVRTITMTVSSSTLYTGELYDALFAQYPTNIKIGPATFEFEVKYTNGVIKTDTVVIDIINDVYDAYLFHQSY